MIQGILNKIMGGSKGERVLRRLDPTIAEINRLEPSMRELSDDQLRDKRGEFRVTLN